MAAYRPWLVYIRVLIIYCFISCNGFVGGFFSDRKQEPMKNVKKHDENSFTVDGNDGTDLHVSDTTTQNDAFDSTPNMNSREILTLHGAPEQHEHTYDDMDKIRKEKRIQRLRRRLTTTDFLGRRADDFYDYATASSHATWISDTRNDKTGQDLITASSYLRCKATHRCPWARVEYDVQGMKYEFTKKAFNTGRWDSIPLFTDFEDWYAGTHGWLHSPDVLAAPTMSTVIHDHDSLKTTQKWRSSQQPSISRGLNPNDFVSSGKLLVNTKVTMHFVTSGATPTLTIGTTVFNGVVATTTSSTKVALFNFDSISISKQVSITAEGNRALVISSKSTIIFDTTFTILPGTLGGFPGTDGSPSINNVTGPGSGSIRLYLHTITTSADDIDEVQTITTSADSGQNLGGTFTLTLSYCERSRSEGEGGGSHDLDKNTESNDAKSTDGLFLPGTIVYDAKTKESCTVLNKNESDAYKWISKTTQKISHDSSALLVSKYLGDLSIISSKVRVGRNISDQQGGHVWRVTFVDAVGDVPEIQPTSYLTGIGAKIETDTYEEGNNIGGSFSIDFLQGTTRSLPYDVSAEAMATALMEDIELVKHARVSRLDPYTLQMCSVSSSRCQGGGPMPSYGYKWSITTTTTSNNISPTSPTSSNIGEKGQKQVMTIKDSGTSLTGIGVSIKVDEGHTLHNSASLHSFSTFYPGDGSNEKHFSLAFGGSGGSYGGLGGKGHSHIDVGPMYGDVQVPDIFGGSSGTVGGIHPREVISAFSSATDNPTGVGGDGGGAIAFVAVNDIIFDVNTNIEVNGKEGGFGYRGGGGGSGGTIIIEAGGSIRQHGRLSAKGGDGGGSVLSSTGAMAGGGGGGGRIFIKSQTLDTKNDNNIEIGATIVDGGKGGEIGDSSCRGIATGVCTGGDGNSCLAVDGCVWSGHVSSHCSGAAVATNACDGINITTCENVVGCSWISTAGSCSDSSMKTIDECDGQWDHDTNKETESINRIWSHHSVITPSYLSGSRCIGTAVATGNCEATSETPCNAVPGCEWNVAREWPFTESCVGVPTIVQCNDKSMQSDNGKCNSTGNCHDTTGNLLPSITTSSSCTSPNIWTASWTHNRQTGCTFESIAGTCSGEPTIVLCNDKSMQSDHGKCSATGNCHDTTGNLLPSITTSSSCTSPNIWTASWTHNRQTGCTFATTIENVCSGVASSCLASQMQHNNSLCSAQVGCFFAIDLQDGTCTTQYGTINKSITNSAACTSPNYWEISAEADPNTRSGSIGSVYTDIASTMRWYIDSNEGAMGTTRSLKVVGGNNSLTASNVSKTNPIVLSGPRFLFPGLPNDSAEKPERVSFFIKLGQIVFGQKENNWGGYVAIHGANFQITSESMIGIGIVNSNFLHGANFAHAMGFQGFQGGVSNTIKSGVDLLRWYKIDIYINWKDNVYDVMIDDEQLVFKSSFVGTSAVALGVYNYHSMSLWIDEVYVGPSGHGVNNLMGFRCPRIPQAVVDPIATCRSLSDGSIVSTKSTLNTEGDCLEEKDSDGKSVNSWHLPEQTLDNVEIQRPTETNWANDEDGAFEDLFWATSQFISHIGDRDQYKFSRGGLLDRDGEKHRRFFRDYVPRTTSTPGGFDSGVLLYVPTERLVDAGTNGGAHTGAGGGGDDVSMEIQEESFQLHTPTGVGEEAGFKSYNRTSTQNSKSGKFYWYGEHQNPAGVASEYHNRGGIGACSTTDFIHWENEGEMLHYSNISDPLGLFPPPSSTPLQASKPKVLYNPTTKKYVMWTQTDDAAGTLGFATVASSFFPNGPFVIESTFFPNGNVTKDQTIFKKPGTDEAYLARTYYATVDYLLPQSIMQPLWESVRKKGTCAKQDETPVDVMREEYCGVCDNSAHTDTLTCLSNGKCKTDTIGDTPEDKCGDCVNVNAAAVPQFLTIKACSLRGICADPADTVGITLRSQCNSEWKPNKWIADTWTRNTWTSYVWKDGDINFGLNYHRAFYHPEYDDYHDTYVQRWRQENILWKVNWRFQNNTIDWVESSLGDNIRKFVKCDPKPNQPTTGEDKGCGPGTGILMEVFETRQALVNIRQKLNKGTITIQIDGIKLQVTAGSIFTALQDTCCCVSNFTVECSDGFQRRCCRCCWIFDMLRVHHIDILEIIRQGLIKNDQDNSLKIDFKDYGRKIPSPEGFTYALDLRKELLGQGSVDSGQVESKFFDPGYSDNNAWKANSVPAVKSQTWQENYLDGNIADNPPHSTKPDKLIGPTRVVEWRRTKYVAVSKMTSDYLGLTSELRTYEGDLTNNDDMSNIFTPKGQFNFDTDATDRVPGSSHSEGGDSLELGPGKTQTTQPLRVYGDMSPFNFSPASDWYSRFHQYRTEVNDRRNDPVNFSNENTAAQS